MSTSNVFNAANKLKNYTITIDSIEMTKQTIISAEIVYSNKTPKLTGILTFKDMYDMNLQIVWKDAIVTIKYMDLFDEEVEKKFKVIDIVETSTDNKEKVISLELQDVFSYTIEQSYITKSFTGNVVDALSAYLDELGLTDDERDFTSSSESIMFAIPQTINNLEWLEIELEKYGFRFYQTKAGIALKSYDDLIPSNFDENDAGKPFTDATDNQLYKNKIYDLIPTHSKRRNVPPITRVYAYDPLQKKIVYSSDEVDVNLMDDFLLNDDDSNFQETSGSRDVYQTHLNFDQTKLAMREKFFSQNELVMVVNGYVKNDLNQIYELKLHGNKGSTDSQAKGNMVLGGKWVSYKVVDKIVGDSLVQKITLNRADTVKKA